MIPASANRAAHPCSRGSVNTVLIAAPLTDKASAAILADHQLPGCTKRPAPFPTLKPWSLHAP